VTGFGFQNYILYELSKTGAKFTEVPTIFRERKAGKSKLVLRDAVEWMKSCLIIRLERSQRFFKFAIVGFIGYLVNASFLALFAWLSFPEWLSWGFSTELAIISNFTWNNLWTFAAEKFTQPFEIFKKFLAFNFTSAGALLIQTVAGTLGVWVFGPQYRQLLLPLIIVFLVLPYNYFMYTVVIWRVQKKK
jgi:dolichol-phosphate mannosyltransferase